MNYTITLHYNYILQLVKLHHFITVTWCLYLKTPILKAQFSIVDKIILKSHLLYLSHVIDICERFFSCNHVKSYNQTRNRMNPVV